MTRLWRSLRLRLAVAGFCAIYFPVVVLFGVVFATSIEDEYVAPADESSVDGATASTTSDNPSPWVIVTMLVLIPVAGGTAWWWAGRAVRPIEDVQRGINEVHGGDLQRRLDIDRGPSEVVALARSFDDMLDRLHTAAQVQQQLIEETSHELRTPLAVLTANADVLLADPHPTSETYRAGLERSRATAERLAAIIDELLVDARGRARTIDRQPTDLVALAESAVAAIQPLAAQRDVEVALDAPEALLCPVDAPSISRAVGNLIDNAVRYAPAGTAVEVAVQLADGGDEAIVAVTDHGPGIPSADQDAIFDRFWRAGDQPAGTGLGLSIGQQIARAHGGSVGVASPGPKGDGCRFELRLPIPVRADA